MLRTAGPLPAKLNLSLYPGRTGPQRLLFTTSGWLCYIYCGAGENLGMGFRPY